MKKILILAYRYPPQSGIGSVRPSKLVKYLTADGYSPDVISVCHGSAPDDGVIRIPHGRLAEKLLSRRRTPAAPQSGESLSAEKVPPLQSSRLCGTLYITIIYRWITTIASRNIIGLTAPISKNTMLFFQLHRPQP